jgi:hypothetical protein
MKTNDINKKAMNFDEECLSTEPNKNTEEQNTSFH